jgi:hypothetical protein
MNNAEVTQLLFNMNTLDWFIDLHIRGESTRVKINPEEAHSIITAFKQGDDSRMKVENDGKHVFFMPVSK